MTSCCLQEKLETKGCKNERGGGESFVVTNICLINHRKFLSTRSLTSVRQIAVKLSVATEGHAKQQDSFNCGVFCAKVGL